MENEQILQNMAEIGLEEKPARVYLATLELGGGIASSIAQKAGVERVNTYYILEQLATDGLVYSAEKEGVRIYIAHSPKKLISKEEEKLKQIKSLMPELLSFESTNAVRPKVKFYEGAEGIKELFNETLELPKGSETLAYSSFHTVSEHLQDFVPEFIAKRAAKGITQRCIAEDTEQTRENLLKNDKRDLRVTRLVPKEIYPFKADQINIFGNKMFIASMKDMLAIVIESETVAQSQRAIFELAWLGAKTLDKSGEM